MAQVQPIQRFWRLLYQDRKEIYKIYIYAVLNGLVNLSLPLGIQAIINLIQGGEPSSAWGILVGFVLLGIAISGILQILQLRIVENIQHHIFARSSFEFAYRFPKIKQSQLNNVYAPEMANRFFDTLTIQKGMPKILIDFSLATFQVVFGLILLALYSPVFIIFGFTLILILIVIFTITGPRGLRTSLKESKYKYAVAHWLEEVARVKNTFKLNGDNDLHLNQTDSKVVNYLRGREAHFKVLINQFSLFVGFKVVVAAGLLILGSILVFQEQLNLGQFVAAEIVIILIINSVEKIINIIDTIYDVLTALEKIGFVTDMELEDEKGKLPIVHNQGLSIQIVHVNFAYPAMQRKLINDLSCSIPSGAKTSIVGSSGSGKSTLLNLLSGLYIHTEGELFINQVPINNINKTQLRSQMGCCLPGNELFSGSIYENITLGRNITNERFYEVIDILKLNHFVAAQKESIETRIGPEGIHLPKGVMQKILLARAIAHQPHLLLLEAPLHNVDEYERQEIIDYIMNPKQSWTVVVVADYFYWKEKSNHIIELKRPIINA